MFVLVVSLPHRMYLILYTSYFWCDIFHHITDRVELYKNIQYLFYWFLLWTTTSSRGRHFTGDSPPETCLTQYKHADLKHQCHPVIQPAGPTSIQMTHQLMRFWSRDPLGPSRLHSVDSAGTEKRSSLLNCVVIDRRWEASGSTSGSDLLAVPIGYSAPDVRAATVSGTDGTPRSPPGLEEPHSASTSAASSPVQGKKDPVHWDHIPSINALHHHSMLHV